MPQMPVEPIGVPKSLGDPRVTQARLEALEQPHVLQLTSFVRQLREEMGAGYSIPYFDPADGGTAAEILFLLEAPGPRAVASGFVSRDNPDETAKNIFLLNAEAGIDRKRTVCWNIVPWYIGTGTKIRPANRTDVELGARSLGRVLALLPNVRVVVFLGAPAAKAEGLVRSMRPNAHLVSIPHPSPVFVNRAPGNRDRILSVLKQVASTVAASHVGKSTDVGRRLESD